MALGPPKKHCFDCSVIKQGSRVGQWSALPLFGGMVCARRGKRRGVFSVSDGAHHLELALGMWRPAQSQDMVVHLACHWRPKEVISEEISI